jgi:predicted transcriptional regulator
MEFTTEELFDAVDGFVRELLARHGNEEPPVDAIAMLQSEFGFTVTIEEEEDEPDEMESPTSRYVRLRGGNTTPKRRNSRELVLRSVLSEEGRHSAAARAIAREMIPKLLAKLGVIPGTEQKSATNQLIGLIAPRILLPKRWFETAARKKNNDLARLKEAFATATYEAIAMKLLELEEICVIAIVDDGTVGLRRSNGVSATKKLTPAEEQCVAKVIETEEPATVRRDGWTARGWPIPTGPYQRIIVRSLPDDV